MHNFPNIVNENDLKKEKKLTMARDKNHDFVFFLVHKICKRKGFASINQITQSRGSKEQALYNTFFSSIGMTQNGWVLHNSRNILFISKLYQV